MTGRRDILDLVPKGGTILEVGVNTGQFAEDILGHRSDVFYIGVDSWKPPFDKAKAGAMALREKFTARCYMVPGDSVEEAKNFEDNYFDLIYIDAAHDYKSVMADLVAYWPKVKKGGIFAGHDYEMKPPVEPWGPIEVKAAVDDWAAPNRVNVIDEPCPTWWMRKE